MQSFEQLQTLLGQALLNCHLHCFLRGIAKRLCPKGDGTKAELPSGVHTTLSGVPRNEFLGLDLITELLFYRCFAQAST